MRPIDTDQVARPSNTSVGLSINQSVTVVSPTKMDEPIEKQFELELRRAQ